LPDSIRDKAKMLLRHYPSKSDVLQAGLIEERAAGSIFEPILSSSIER
jgi:hypothetical protein